MLLTIVYRFPLLPMRFRTALQAVLWFVLAVLLLLLATLVCVAVAPYLTTLLFGVGITLAYAVVTYPKAKVQP